MDPVLMLFILLLLLIVWLFIRKRQASTAANAKPTRSAAIKSTPYHAVSIQFSSNACSAAKAMAGRRFLSTSAPTFPLPDCNVVKCDCHFSHHGDRRARKDRRSPFASSIATDGTGSFEKERREKSERRHEDDFEF